MVSKAVVRDAKLSEFVPDASNANAGTERGRYMLEASVDEVGAGRSLVADRRGRVVAGNKTQEVFVQAGMENAIVVETDGTRPIIHVRTDWDLDDQNPNNPARRYAYWDNRTSEVGLSWSPDQMALDMSAGMDFSKMFLDAELSAVIPDPLDLESVEPTAGDTPEQTYHCPKCGFEWAEI